MLSALYLFTVMPLVILLLNLFVGVRVWRASWVEGLCVILLWPVGGIWSLVQHWNNPEVRIRAPMLLALALSVLWLSVLFTATQASKEAAAHYAKGHQYSSSGENDLARQLRLSVALSNVPLLDGRIDIPQAHAAIDVPEHFRYVDRAALEKLYAEADEALDPTMVGWLAHESVNLADDDAWYIEINWNADGFVKEGDAPLTSAETLLSETRRVNVRLAEQSGEDAGDLNLVRYAEAPAFDANVHGATWVEEMSDGKNEHELDCYAIRLGRHGALTFTIGEVGLQRQELCLRSVRLAAARTQFADGHGYTDHSRIFDHNAKYELADLITGASMLPRR